MRRQNLFYVTLSFVAKVNASSAGEPTSQKHPHR